MALRLTGSLLRGNAISLALRNVSVSNYCENRRNFSKNKLLTTSKNALGIFGRPVSAVYCSAKAEELPASYSNHFKAERIWTVAMIPLFPISLFVHNPVMDFLLATGIALHCYWGFDTVMADYMTPLGLSPALKKIAPFFIMAVSLIMYIGLLHFNYSDVGITKAFEMIWSL